MQRTQALLDFFAEVQPIFAFLGKDSANRMQTKAALLDFFAEVQPIFAFGCKDKYSRKILARRPAFPSKIIQYNPNHNKVTQ